MPIVPRSNQGRQVADVVGAQRIVSEDPGLDGIAQGLGALGNSLGSVALDLKRQNDEARATDLLTAAETQWQQALFNDDDGLLNRHGQDVMDRDDQPGVIQSGRDRRAAILEEALAQADNETQRNALSRAWASRDRFANSTLQRHTVNEINAYRDASDAAFITERQQSLATVSPEERPIVEAELRQKARQIAERRGLDPDIAEGLERQYLSPAYTNAILTLSESDPAQARQLFEDKKEFIDAKLHRQIERALRTDTSTQQAEFAFDSVIGALGRDATIAEYDDYISSRFSGEAEAKALRRIKRFVDSRDASERQEFDDAEERNARELRLFFRKNPSGDDIARERDALEGRLIRAGLPEERTSSVLDLYDQLAEGPDVKTDAVFFNEILTNPAAFVDQPVSERARRLNETDLETANAAIRDFVSDPSGGASGAALQPLLNAFDRNRIGSKTLTHKQLRGELIQAYVTQVGAEAANGPITAQRRTEIANQIIASRTSSSFFGEPSFEETDEISDAEVSAEPDLWALAYHRASNGGRLVPTDDQVRANFVSIVEYPERVRRAEGPDAAVRATGEIRRQGEDARLILFERGSDWADRVNGRDVFEERARRDAEARAATEAVLLEEIDELNRLVDRRR